MEKEVQATYSDKIIQVKIRFWTDGIAKKEGHIIPKHCYSSGYVLIAASRIHGIPTGIKAPFVSISGLPKAIDKVMAEAQLILHLNRAKSQLTLDLNYKGKNE